MNSESLRNRINELGLDSYQSQILELARPSLEFLTSRSQIPLPPHESKIGGLPDLPPGVEWPVSNERIPLLFLGRINANDCKRIFPTIDTHLLFFAEWDYSCEGRVIPSSPDMETIPAQCPPRPDDAHPELNKCSLEIHECVSLPGTQAGPEKALYTKEMLNHNQRPDKFWGPSVMHFPLNDLAYETSCPSNPRKGIFRLRGYPLFTQAHPIINANLNPSTAGITDWRSLMTFGDDEDAALCYGDTGFCGFMTTDTAPNHRVTDFIHFFQDSM